MSPRHLANKTLALIDTAYEIAASRYPITVRGICYQLSPQGFITSMRKSETNRVGRAVRIAREQGLIPWEWIVDEHREIERPNTWVDPVQYFKTVRRSYRKDRWEMQPERLLVMSEKGTVGGVLRPVLDEYGIPFLVVHGFNSATLMKDIAVASQVQRLTILYIGDFDPSGLYMPLVDIPSRLAAYGGDADVVRVALLESQLAGLPSLPAKQSDTRYQWYQEQFGNQAWELDALDPNHLRAAVDQAVQRYIDDDLWEQAGNTETAELKSLSEFFDANPNLFLGGSQNKNGGAS